MFRGGRVSEVDIDIICSLIKSPQAIPFDWVPLKIDRNGDEPGCLLDFYSSLETICYSRESIVRFASHPQTLLTIADLESRLEQLLKFEAQLTRSAMSQRLEFSKFARATIARDVFALFTGA